MLYTPPAFALADRDAMFAEIEAAGLALLVTQGAEGPLISHLPMLLDRQAGPHGTLLGHLAKANPQLTLSNLKSQAVAVFMGPDAYVSPGWYASKREHGKVVPTWNYTTVHARGRLEFFDDKVRLRAVVDRLTAKHEAQFAKPWSPADAPADFIEAQLKGIIGVALAIETLEGKRKLSQNRPEADRLGVIDGLSAQPGASDQATAALMRNYRP